MSETVQKIIPVDIETELSEDFVNDAIAFINNHYGEVEIEYIDYEEVTFIDCGTNLKTIKCNNCDEVLSIEWWGSQMSNWYENHDLSIILPCCEAETSLNDLNYNLDCGFSTFEFRLLNPMEYVDVEHFSYHSSIEFKSVIANF